MTFAARRRLWSAADTLRADSNYASNEYFLPVMGLVFLRHAYSRFLSVKDAIEAALPTRAGKTRPLTKEDFSPKSAIFLRPKAQFDTLVALPDSADRAKAIIDAMESIEADYENLRGVLPKSENQELDNAVLGQLLRKADFVMVNPPFNVDEIDADKVESDPRLPLGLPGVNKKGKVSNGNYVWISCFYSYLNEQGPSRVRHVVPGLLCLPRRGQGAPEAGRDRRRGCHGRHPLRLLSKSHLQDRQLFPRARAEPAWHRLALPGRDRALPRPGGGLG
ncbi:type I restriction-modification system subunit M N-terminal domain-containing protein [Thioalkalicoccus limnaeus]|uniref:Type I restriction-modification system subunit M N-terminal domain-containing protein n=1 Tax=Thioalkalicoccus limnaeus TaxID=120681 RepID=A0ABV4BJI1_9GAMM